MCFEFILNSLHVTLINCLKSLDWALGPYLHCKRRSIPSKVRSTTTSPNGSDFSGGGRPKRRSCWKSFQQYSSKLDQMYTSKQRLNITVMLRTLC